MKALPDDDVCEVRIELADGRLLVRHYVKYDPSRKEYLDSTRNSASHYFECIYNPNGDLQSRRVKKNNFGNLSAEDLIKEFRI